MNVPRLNKGVGTCFVEVEVDTWTGNWRFFDPSMCMTPDWSSIRWLPKPTWSVRWWKARKSLPTRFPGTANFPARATTASAICPTGCPPSWTSRNQTQLYIDSLEPRWFYGVKSFSETSIGAVPGAIANAIYNACGVRIREHPVTREKIMAGLRRAKEARMKKVSIYRPTCVDEAIQILSHHGTEAGVYAGGTDLLIRLKNRLQQAPTYLVDIKKIENLRYIKEDSAGRRTRSVRQPKLAELADSDCCRSATRCWSRPST